MSICAAVTVRVTSDLRASAEGDSTSDYTHSVASRVPLPPPNTFSLFKPCFSDPVWSQYDSTSSQNVQPNWALALMVYSIHKLLTCLGQVL